MCVTSPTQLSSPVCLASQYFFSLFSFHSNVIDLFSFFHLVDCRFVTIWSLPLADQIFLLLLLLLHLLHSSSNNNHTHLIITRLSMIDGLTSGHHTYIDVCIHRSFCRSHFFTQSLSLTFLSSYFTSLLSQVICHQHSKYQVKKK
jgi:hypothetical protein